MTSDQPIFREYLRVSYDASGVERSNTEQHHDNVTLADELDVTLHPKPYIEVGSASRFAAAGSCTSGS